MEITFLLLLLFGISYLLWEPKLDTIYINGEKHIILWYNSPDTYRQFIILW